ncbi:PBP1A family penicillin-binding protein [Alkalihalophilus lindianensis]|uniref:PBP1A family penicillin-binding protein n=1 Tax=Alkalihalophilus lindianensis TaxID=1630542 RepID=A0ABU3XEH1_9BACI|nr:PBP1A family penicillin-binding protein [Alkalihalophilus lindianensis]MDV2686292.1 PBP1A family penicillin-binding protein [Alkalihalophilus lindianensis]
MLLKRLSIGIIIVLSTVLIGLVGYLFILLAGNFAIDNEKLVMNTTTSLVDENGELLTKLYIENRELVSIDDIPDHVEEAFVAIEDARFYEHQGVDFRAIGRAIYRDILAGAKVEGGSTITQQLAKNVFLSNEKTWLRKTKEVMIAMNLERKYSKEELLEMYLNRIYFGHGAYGVQAASKLYFNKPVNELSVDEGALLAGLPKAPNSYSPISNPDRSKQRRDVVLTVMERRGYISAEEAVRYKGRTIAVDHNKITENDAYLTYIDMVLDEAAETYQLTNEEVLSGGYRIVVPMSQTLQQSTYDRIRNDDYFPDGNEEAEAAAVFMDVKTGGILAVQGGREYVRRGLNRVESKRQPGSAFKPLAVFAPALEEGQYGPYSMLRDEALTYGGDYTPRNSNGEYSGQVTMYDAITHSTNAPAVWLLNELGVKKSTSFLEQLGMKVPDKGLSIALGGLEEGVTPFEMMKAYRAFANQGKMIEPHFISAIYDRNGELIGRANEEETEVVSEQTAWYMTRMLESVVKEGTAKSGTVDTPLAGKTGTTSFPGVEGGTMDAWFVGYTPSVVGSVWMGYDLTTTDNYLLGGSSYPTVMMKDILNDLEPTLKNVAFEKPEVVDELLPPVRLATVNDLSAKLQMGGRGLMSVELDWTGSKDERVYYHVYEVHKGERERLATVVGDSNYVVSRFNPFSSKTYEVAPVDSLTNQEGDPSNRAEAEFSLGF